MIPGPVVSEPLVLGAIVGVSALAIVVAVLIVRRLVDVRPRAETTVQSYLHAISSGDAASANALFDPTSIDRDAFPTATDRVGLMSDAALGAATERIGDVTVHRVTGATGSDAAVASVSFGLGGERHEKTIILNWDGTAWRITQGIWQLLQVRPVFTGSGTTAENIAIRLGDARPDRPDLAFEGSFLAYPGVYPLEITAQGWMIEPGSSVPETVTLAGGRAAVVRPRFIPLP